MPAQLVALNEGPSILLDKGILLIGRHPECDIQIESRKISRRHCCIAQVHDYLIVRDLGSTNGIRINGSRVAEGRLAAGDELTIGNHRYQVAYEGVVRTPARRQKPKDTFQSPAHEGELDDVLESCDEPVPLAEPGVQLGNVPTPCSRSALPKPPSTDDDESYILPDNLELMPGSEGFPNLHTPTGSHHPGG
jgi:predicted component of type VI protein secretion system